MKLKRIPETYADKRAAPNTIVLVAIVVAVVFFMLLLGGINATASGARVMNDGCSGVRPGAEILVFEDDLKDPANANGPTMNFIFEGSDGYLYVGIAGHSVAQGLGEVKSWPPGQGSPALDAQGNRIGRVAFVALRATGNNVDSIRDFALVRLEPAVAANPTMCEFGGPVGMYGKRSSSPVVLHHYGQGDAFEDLAPGRTAVAGSTPNRFHVFAEGLIDGGDSGSPFVTAEGRAVGHLSGTCLPACLGGTPPPQGTPTGETGHLLILRTKPQLILAENRLGIRLSLMTADRMHP